MNQASASAVVENSCLCTVVDAASGYPVAFGFKHFVECVNGSHFVAAGFFGLIVDYKDDVSHVAYSARFAPFL